MTHHQYQISSEPEPQAVTPQPATLSPKTKTQHPTDKKGAKNQSKNQNQRPNPGHTLVNADSTARVGGPHEGLGIGSGRNIDALIAVTFGMDLFVYVATHDTGFAPNPFHGYCTLATCKPRIRQRAQVGDWVVGLGSKRNLQEGKLIYAMQVQEKMSFDEYWGDPRFTKKKPKRTGRQESECGDNIYHTNTKTGEWIQKRGYHSLANGCPDLKKPKKTLPRRKS